MDGTRFATIWNKMKCLWNPEFTSLSFGHSCKLDVSLEYLALLVARESQLSGFDQED